MKNQTNQFIQLSLVATLLGVATGSVRAADTNNVPATGATVTAPAGAASSTSSLAAAPDADPWQFSATPFLWVVQLGGKVKTQNRELNVNLSFDQIINHLDGPPLMLNLQLRKKNYGFYTTPLYVKLTADANNPGPVTIVGGNDTVTLWVVETGGYYQIYKSDGENPLSLDVLGGIRYWNFNNDISLNIPGSLFAHSRDANLWDPFVGLRLSKYLTEKLSVRLTGECGGFAISESTPNDSWVAEGMLGYDFTQRFTLLAGYHALGVNTYNKTGQGDIRANITFQGAVVGFKFTF